MKLVPNGYDTVSNRLLVSAALSECLYSESITAEYARTMHSKLVAQAMHISSEAVRLELGLYDLKTVAIRLKEVLDKYLNPLMTAISEKGYHGVLFRLHASRFIACADTEIRQLRFTLEDSEACHLLAA